MSRHIGGVSEGGGDEEIRGTREVPVDKGVAGVVPMETTCEDESLQTRGDEHSAIEEAFLARRVGGVVQGGVDEGNRVIVKVLVDDGPVGVVPVTMVTVDDGPVGCSDVEGVGEGDVRGALSDDHGAGKDNADG